MLTRRIQISLPFAILPWLVFVTACADAERGGAASSDAAQPERDGGSAEGSVLDGAAGDGAPAPDASSDFDGRTNSCAPDMDSGPFVHESGIDSGLLVSDSGADAGDAGCMHAPSECGRSGELAVSCGTLVCSGETPLCCSEGSDHSCVATENDCYTYSDPLQNMRKYVSRCDDENDCPAGLFCWDGYSKGLGHDNGAVCSTICGHGGYSPYLFQRCKQTCECQAGEQCQDGRCVGRP